jgi:predicted nuclease with TOPRIM domain
MKDPLDEIRKTRESHLFNEREDLFRRLLVLQDGYENLRLRTRTLEVEANRLHQLGVEILMTAAVLDSDDRWWPELDEYAKRLDEFGKLYE